MGTRMIFICLRKYETPIDGKWNYPSVCGMWPLMIGTEVIMLSGRFCLRPCMELKSIPRLICCTFKRFKKKPTHSLERSTIEIEEIKTILIKF